MKWLFFTILSSLYSFLIKFVFYIFSNSLRKKDFLAGSYVISVGNIVAGGTGKTPMISYLIYLLKKEGFSCGIVSRGYKRKKGGTVIVSDGHKTLSSVVSSGDEPYMLSKEHKNAPIVVGKKTTSCKLMHNQFNPDFILVDDGFQSLGLKRNLNIVLIDLSQPLRYYFVLPLGFLREPLSGLSRADVVIFTKSNSVNKNKLKIKNKVIKHINKEKTLVLEASLNFQLFFFNEQAEVFESYKKIDERVLCFSGIARPNLFIKKARGFCRHLVKTLSFKDHHNYTLKDFNKIKDLMIRFQASSIITTKKDFWKIKTSFSGFKVFIIDINHSVLDEKKLLSLILSQKN